MSGNRRFAIFAWLLLLAPAVPAAEVGNAPGFGGERGRLARSLYLHDFENRRDPDTGAFSLDSAVLNLSGWPDFWEPIRAVGFPEYLLDGVAVIPDESGQIAGAYRDLPNHVLRIGFDGGRIGLRTRVPVPVNPELAYEFSLLSRDSGLQGVRIQAGVEWLKVDPASSRSLRSDEIPDFAPGQVDWPVSPRRMLVNQPPPDANAARFFLIIGRRPGDVGGFYQGEIRFDDISFRPMPRINVEPAPAADGKPDPRLVRVRYSGLFDNIPDPANPGYFRGKRYSRRVTATDVLNRPIRLGLTGKGGIEADASGAAAEEVRLPGDRFGVYYLDISLYDAGGSLIADSLRSVAMYRPERRIDPLASRRTKPAFGVRAGLLPAEIVADADFLGRLARGIGVRAVKIIPWRDSYAGTDDDNGYYRLMSGAVRGLRAAGIGVIGAIRPPAGRFGQLGIADVMDESPERLVEALAGVGRNLGLLVDAWQWGDDQDASLSGIPAGEKTDRFAAALAGFAGGLPVAVNQLAGTGWGGFPFNPETINLFFPDADDAGSGIWEKAAEVFPWLFEPYAKERGRIYPPARLSRLAPPPPGDAIEAQTRAKRRFGSWLTLESTPAWPVEPNAGSEKAQLDQFLIRAIHAAALAPDLVFLGELFDPERGLLRQDDLRANILETMARPAYLAAGVATELLEGAEYLGQLGLLPPFEAHVFRRPGTDEAVIALWHHDAREERRLPRAEIAEGPVLSLVDWAGNRDPLPASIPVRRTPSFITGLSASLVLTRMSVRVAPEPPLLAEARRQNQTLEVVNHLAAQTPVVFQLSYAARQADGGMENNWTVTPPEARLNLPPASPAFTPNRLKLSVSPDANSQTEIAGPGWSDKFGWKLAKAGMRVNAAQPADMTLYLPFRLQSELDVDIERLPRADDPGFAILQLRMRWHPRSPRRELRLFPYYMKYGGMKEQLPFPITIKSTPPELRGKPETMFESVELRIPVTPLAQTWVGLKEDGGSSFFIVDVTEFLDAP